MGESFTLQNLCLFRDASFSLHWPLLFLLGQPWGVYDRVCIHTPAWEAKHWLGPLWAQEGHVDYKLHCWAICWALSGRGQGSCLQSGLLVQSGAPASCLGKHNPASSVLESRAGAGLSIQWANHHPAPALTWEVSSLWSEGRDMPNSAQERKDKPLPSSEYPFKTQRPPSQGPLLNPPPQNFPLTKESSHRERERERQPLMAKAERERTRE